MILTPLLPWEKGPDNYREGDELKSFMTSLQAGSLAKIAHRAIF